MNELIKQARELCGAATPGPWNNFGDWMIHTEPDVEHNGIPNKKTIGTVRKNNAAFIAASRTLVPQLCDALEAAEKENEGLKNILQFNMVQIHGERMTVLDALSSLTARAEKAEAKIKSIHESLNFADKSRSKCANYVELAVSNGLALGKIAVSIQHDYDAEPPEGV